MLIYSSTRLNAVQLLGGVAVVSGKYSGMRIFERLQGKGRKTITTRNNRSLCAGRKKADYVLTFQGVRWAG